MKKQTTLPSTAPDQTEALLQGLIAECQSIIRDVVLPGIRETDDHGHRRYYIHSITDLVESATKLGDAIGRLRGTQPQPEIRQRITVERVQKLAAPEAET
jgi:hypothetical protein